MNLRFIVCSIVFLAPLMSIAQNVPRTTTDYIFGDYQVIQSKGLFGIKNVSSKKILVPCSYKEIFVGKTELAKTVDYFNVVDQTGKEGVYSSKTKKLVIPCKYLSIKNEYYDFYSIKEGDEDYDLYGFSAKYFDGKDTLIDFYSKSAKKILTSKYNIHISKTDEGENIYLGAYSDNDNNKHGYFLFNSVTSQLVINKQYAKFDFLPKKHAAVLEAGKWGVIELATGNPTIPIVNDSITQKSWSDLLHVYSGGKESVYNLDCKLIIPSGSYTEVGEFRMCNVGAEYLYVASARLKNKWGCIDQNNKILVPFEYDKAPNYSDTMPAYKNDKYGFISGQNIILPFNLSRIIYKKLNTDLYDENSSKVDNEFYCASADGKWGIINLKGKIIVDLKYDKPFDLTEKMWVSKNGNWGCIDKNQNVIIDFKLDTLVYGKPKFNDKGVTAIVDGQIVQLDNDGNEFSTGLLVDIVRKSDKKAFISAVKRASREDKAKALYYAIASYNTEMVKLLMENKPELKLVYDEKPPIYHLAIKAKGAYGEQYYRSIEILKSLLKSGADVNQRGFANYTAIMAYVEGAFNRNIEFVQLLIDYGADVSLKDNNGETVFDKAGSLQENIKDLINKYKK